MAIVMMDSLEQHGDWHALKPGHAYPQRSASLCNWAGGSAIMLWKIGEPTCKECLERLEDPSVGKKEFQDG